MDLGTEICRDPKLVESHWERRLGSAAALNVTWPRSLGDDQSSGIGGFNALDAHVSISSGLAPGYRGSSQSFNVSAEKFVSDGSIHVPASSETTRWRCHLHDSSNVCLASKQKWSAT